MKASHHEKLHVTDHLRQTLRLPKNLPLGMEDGVT